MKKYIFNTNASVPRMTKGGRIKNFYKEKEMTQIELNGDTISVMRQKTMSTKGTVEESSKNSNIFNIKSINFRKSKNYMTIFKISLGIAVFMFMFCIVTSMSQEYVTIRNKLEFIGVPLIFGLGFHVVTTTVIIFCRVPIKACSVSFNDNEIITFSYYKKDFSQLKEVVTDIKNINPNIKECNTEKIITRIVVFGVSLLLLFQLSWIGIGYYFNYKYQLREQELTKAIKEGDYYTEEEIRYLKYVAGDTFGYNIYREADKYVKIKETDVETYTGQEKRMLMLKIYSKSKKGYLLAEKYVEFPNNSSISKYGYSYYQYASSLYKLKEPVGKVNLFDKDSQSNLYTEQKIYDFVHLENENNNLNDYEYVDSYYSKYGKCYIIKTINKEDSNYYMYVDIDNIKYEAMILESQTNFDDEEKMIKYFKNSLPEANYTID